MKQVIAMHGWCGDSAVWLPWRRHFSRRGWQWSSGERGYGRRVTCEPTWSEPTPSSTPHRRAVIGHSLGPHLLSPGVLTHATDVVLLASFGRFIPEGKDGRALRTGLRGMRTALGSPAEATMLQTFLERAAQPASPMGLTRGPAQQGLSMQGRERMRQDLERLISSSGLPEGMPSGARVLVVDAAADAIVAPSASRDQMLALTGHLQHAPERWWLKDAGHSLLVPDLLIRVQQWLDHDTSAI